MESMYIVAVKKDDFSVIDMPNIVNVAFDVENNRYTLTQTNGGTNVINAAQYHLQFVWRP